jgi:hypothetical protein
MDEDDPRDQDRTSSFDDDDRSSDDSEILPNTLDASSLVDTIPESVNKDSKFDIEGPDLDSDAIDELLMDIDDDSNESQVDT